MEIEMQNNFINTNAFSNVQSKDVQSSKDAQSPFFSKTEGDIVNFQRRTKVISLVYLIAYVVTKVEGQCILLSCKRLS